MGLPQEELSGEELSREPLPVHELEREEFPREAVATDQWALDALARQTGASVSSSNRALWIEVAVVLLICVLPDLYSAVNYAYAGRPGTLSATLVREQPWLIVRSSGVIALILFIVSKSGQTWAYFGIRRLRWMDFLLSVAVYLAGIVRYYVSIYVLYFSLASTGLYHAAAQSHHAAAPVAGGVAQIQIIILASLANGWAEELVCRAYLIARFTQLLRSPVAAIFLSAFLFSSYHIYQGTWPMIGIFGVGLAYGAIFVWTKRIWPLALGHAIQDIVSLMMLTLHR